MKISNRDARKLFLKQQGLLSPNEFGRGKRAALSAVKRLSYLQIDTISVVSRAHEHVLTSRVENFSAPMLHRLHNDRHLFEYWSHAAAYLPFEHYRYYMPVMKGFAASREYDRKLAAAVMKRIATEGPLSSKDFEDTRAKKESGWWQWKPAKLVLEHMFLSGDLMVSRRDGFQKVYDLPENVIPAGVDTTCPSTADWSDYIVSSMLEALGIATEYDLGYARATIRRLCKTDLKQPIRQTISRLTETGKLLQVDVGDRTCYTTEALLDNLPLRSYKKFVKFLSPFDNLIINRKRTEQLFDFDYQLECYVPAAKRKYGYFSLPALWGDAIIGRMDAKADRATGTMLVRNLVLEPKIKIDDALLESLSAGISIFANQNQCDSIVIENCQPKMLIRELKTLGALL